MSKNVQSEIITLDDAESTGIEKAAESSQQIAQREWNYNQLIKPRYEPDDLIKYAELSVWHAACLNLWTAVTVDMGWDLVSDEEGATPDDDYDTITNYLQNEGFPGADEPFEETLHRFAYDYFAIGDGYLEQALANGNQDENWGEFYHMPGHTVRRIAPRRVNQYKIAENGERGYKQKRGIETSDEFVLPDQAEPGDNVCWHYRRYDPRDDYYGLPRWIPAIGAIALDRSALEFNLHLFENEMTGKIIISVTGGELSKDTMQNIRDFVHNNLRGITNAGRVLLLKSQSEQAKISVEHLWKGIEKNKDLPYGQGRSDSRDEIIAAHNVPPRLVGIMSAAQLGGTGEVQGQLQTFKELYVEPEQQRLEQWMMRGPLEPVFRDSTWRLQFRRMDISDFAETAGAWSGLVSNQIAETDEAREAIGLAIEKSHGSMRQIGNGIQVKDIEGVYHLLKSVNEYIEG